MKKRICCTNTQKWRNSMQTCDFSRLMTLSPDAQEISAGVWESSKPIFRFTDRGRHDNVLCLQEKGDRVFYAAGREPLTLHEGELIFIPITTCYTSVAFERIRWRSVNFRLMLGGELLYINEPFRILKNGGDYRSLMENTADCGHSPLRAKSALFALLAEICENAREDAVRKGGFSSIYEVVTAMEQHPEHPFSVAEAARMCYLSDTGFRTKFKQITGGFTPMEYRNRLRIDRVDALIRTENFTLDAIAEMLGFWDCAHLCRIYKQVRGCTPGQRFKQKE